MLGWGVVTCWAHSRAAATSGEGVFGCESVSVAREVRERANLGGSWIRAMAARLPSGARQLEPTRAPHSTCDEDGPASASAALVLGAPGET